MKKKSVIIALVALFIIGAGIGFAAGQGKNAKNITTTKQPAEASVTAGEPASDSGAANPDSDGTTEPTADESTSAPEESTSENTTDEASCDFLYTGYWYYYDEDMTCAFAFGFPKDDDDAELAYFNTENVTGLDAKYLVDEADFEISGNTLTVDDLPGELRNIEFQFTIKDGKLLYGDTELEHYDDLSLEYPYDHWNA